MDRRTVNCLRLLGCFFLETLRRYMGDTIRGNYNLTLRAFYWTHLVQRVATLLFIIGTHIKEIIF